MKRLLYLKTFILIIFILMSPNQALSTSLSELPLKSFIPSKIGKFEQKKVFQKTEFSSFQRRHSLKGIVKSLNADYSAPAPILGPNKMIMASDIFVSIYKFKTDKDAQRRFSKIATEGDTQWQTIDGVKVFQVTDNFQSEDSYSVDVWIGAQFGDRFLEIWHSKSTKGVPLSLREGKEKAAMAFRRCLEVARQKIRK